MSLTDPSKIDPEHLERVLSKLEPEARTLVLRAIAEKLDGSNSTLELLNRVLYHKMPPPIDEFIYAKEYLHLPKGVLYPAVQELIYRIDAPSIRESFICAGKGSGKSSLTTILMARAIHTIAYCMRDPSSFFGVLPGTSIAVLNMSISASQAESVIFAKLLALLENGRCFYNGAIKTFLKRKRYIEFPKGVQSISGHSGYKAYFGYDVFAGVLDEFSWFHDDAERSVAEEVFSGVQGSCKTRFPKHYKIIAISTPQSKECPTYRRITGAMESGIEPEWIGENQDGGRLDGEIDGDNYAKVL